MNQPKEEGIVVGTGIVVDDDLRTETITSQNQLMGDFVFSNPQTGEEMLKISYDGFYVRGKKLEQDENEAKEVFDAMRGWLKATQRL